VILAGAGARLGVCRTAPDGAVPRDPVTATLTQPAWFPRGARPENVAAPSSITARAVTAGQQPAWATGVMAAFVPVRQGGHRPGWVSRSHGYSHRLPVRQRLRRGVILGEETALPHGRLESEGGDIDREPPKQARRIRTYRPYDSRRAAARLSAQRGRRRGFRSCTVTARHLRNGVRVVHQRSGELAGRVSNGTRLRLPWRQGRGNCEPGYGNRAL
jgi:hypothetical protein